MESLFQPIMGLLQCRPIGFEALLRLNFCDGSPSCAPDQFFATLPRQDLIALDLACMISHAQRVGPQSINHEYSLFLNVEPLTLLHASDQILPKKLLVDYELNESQIVLELTERLPEGVTSTWIVEHKEKWIESIHMLHDRGFGLALDDWEPTQLGQFLAAEVRPDYIKIGRSFWSGIPLTAPSALVHDRLNRLRNRIEQSGSCMIIEGIETIQQLECIRKVGITTAQGYLFGKPLPAINVREGTTLEHC